MTASMGEGAANDEMTPAMRLLTLQSRHQALDAKIMELQGQPYQKSAFDPASQERKNCVRKMP